MQINTPVTLPNGEAIKIPKKGLLPMDNKLSTTATTAYILPNLHNTSLLSIGQLCNDDCVAIFDKKNMYIVKNKKIILKGIRNLTDGLWDVILNNNAKNNHYNKSTNLLNVIVQKSKSNYELANFLHACACSPAIKTFQLAINKNFFATWPGIEKLKMEQHIQDTTNIDMGHFKKERQNLQTTKTRETLASIIPFTAKEMSYGDLTGAFPYTSTRGNKYLYILYDYDSNSILVEPIKNRQAASITNAWKRTHDRLTKHGHATKNFIMDNECSTEFKKSLIKHNIKFQLVPPNEHRANAAERAIQTFKQIGRASCRERV